MKESKTEKEIEKERERETERERGRERKRERGRAGGRERENRRMLENEKKSESDTFDVREWSCIRAATELLQSCNSCNRADTETHLPLSI